jgi:hypothetical protein
MEKKTASSIFRDFSAIKLEAALVPTSQTAQIYISADHN